MEPGGIVSAMLENWSSPDRKSTALASHFAEDATYKPAPGLAPIVGRFAIQRFTGVALASFDKVEIEVLHQTVDGMTVMNERMDTLRRGHRVINVPAMGIFEIKGGLIAVWRDYSDLGSFFDGIDVGSQQSNPRPRRFGLLRRSAQPDIR
ncbi:limonene-1,2-epoxide hydrolase family protein [Nocardia sp. Marseille-Q1738]